MADATAYLKIFNIDEYPLLQRIDYQEIRRYAGLGRTGLETDGDVNVADGREDELIEECLKEVLPLLTYKVSYRKDDKVPFDSHGSKDLAKNLEGCGEVVCFAATIGIAIDRLISKYNHISPVKALFMQAIGAERIEALCNLFNSEIRDEAVAKGGTTRPRFSPGYGDLPLEVQKEFVILLDCSRRLGVTLNESLLMSPSKSVTAIIGVSYSDAQDKVSGICDPRARRGSIEEAVGAGDTSADSHDCARCGKTDCEYRRV